ncbi:MAG TPA: hypothetical protein VKY92_02695 [Verrucomicrobiae bacterium]|nr:hypothetical protein [Verrucomicrobiae bacterium]
MIMALLTPMDLASAPAQCSESADPAKDVGPFKILYEVDESRHLLQAEQCKTCGFVVVRKLDPKPKTPQPKSSQS